MMATGGGTTRYHQTLWISDQTEIHDVTITDCHLVDHKLNGYCRLDSFPQIQWLCRQVDPLKYPTTWIIVGWIRQ